MTIIQTTALPYPSTEKVTKTFAVGTTLKVMYKTYQVMSDIWEQGLCAEYWDEERGCVETADWIDSGSKVDATPDVIAKAESWLYDRKYQSSFQKRKSYEEQESRRIVKESLVRVVSGRTAKGTEGKVAVVIQRAYGMGYRSTVEDKLGIATSEVKVKVPGRNGQVYDSYRDIVWVWARNCELVEVPAIDLESVRKVAEDEARYEVKGRDWRNQARS